MIMASGSAFFAIIATAWSARGRWRICGLGISGGAFGLRGKKGLIVSPSSSERMFFRNQGLSDITTLDIRAEVEPDIQGDLCEADFLPDDTYHFIYASYVFPFLHDYQKALWHIRRVLKTDGIFVNFVPVHNRRPTIHHQVGAENSGWYGKENFEKYNIGEYTTFGDLGSSKTMLDSSLSRRSMAGTSCRGRSSASFAAIQRKRHG